MSRWRRSSVVEKSFPGLPFIKPKHQVCSKDNLTELRWKHHRLYICFLVSTQSHFETDTFVRRPTQPVPTTKWLWTRHVRTCTDNTGPVPNHLSHLPYTNSVEEEGSTAFIVEVVSGVPGLFSLWRSEVGVGRKQVMSGRYDWTKREKFSRRDGTLNLSELKNVRNESMDKV